MPFNKTHVQYALAQFDRGVSPRQILVDLQYRDFLPSINAAKIERCLRDNGRVLQNNQRAGNARSGQNFPTGPAATASRGTFATVTTIKEDDEHHFVDPGPTMNWDVLADAFALAAYRAGKSGVEIWSILRTNGYDISRSEVVVNLVWQGEKLDEVLKRK